MNLSNLVLPLLILVVFTYSYKKTNIYEKFMEGATESFKIVLSIFPSLLAMLLAVNIFIKSGILDYVVNFFTFPSEELIMILLRPISSSSSLAILSDIYTKYGVDSNISIVSSVIQGSSETTFYVISLYFGVIGIKNTRYALQESLICDIIGIIVSIIVVKILF